MDKNTTYEPFKFWEDLKSGHFTSMIKETSKGNILSNAQEVYNTMKPFFAKHPDVEKMYCIFLDTKNKIIAIEEISSGSISSSPVYPRELLKAVLKKQASAVVLVHNHPSGDVSPSFEDFKITAKVNMALISIDAQLHDHLIIGDTWYSFAEQGWIEMAKTKYREFITSSKHIR
ncbi:MAG: DNA repair protein RadC [Proteobacteria bacterium]|nr:DNA repair protein RadC [Pseudomonadota bacterium]MBU1387884.1 DNA repair protein RadC [Pseudomonadota bacterium]MBU1544330.1 DNA repair protein RadC [Pseudomonadota bacterium]MBU2482665.1 DNA repair protein RadC [Pseudomonadota bacterium]